MNSRKFEYIKIFQNQKYNQLLAWTLILNGNYQVIVQINSFDILGNNGIFFQVYRFYSSTVLEGLLLLNFQEYTTLSNGVALFLPLRAHILHLYYYTLILIERIIAWSLVQSTRFVHVMHKYEISISVMFGEMKSLIDYSVCSVVSKN